MMVFERMELPGDNTRKCMIETRPDIAGTYKGYIFCQDLDEARGILETTRKSVMSDISANVPVSLKRSCSEYVLA